jgi:hypothetical protein
MDNRMRSNLMRGRSIVNDSAIHTLFTKLTEKHSEVLSRMNNLDTERGKRIFEKELTCWCFRVLRGLAGSFGAYSGSTSSVDGLA